MAERRTELPALEARRWFLEHEYHYAQRQADDAIREGHADIATQQWIVNVRAELDELNYVLRILGAHDQRIEITRRTLVVAVLGYGLIMVAVIVFLMRYYGV